VAIVLCIKSHIFYCLKNSGGYRSLCTFINCTDLLVKGNNNKERWNLERQDFVIDDYNRKILFPCFTSDKLKSLLGTESPQSMILCQFVYFIPGILSQTMQVTSRIRSLK
jgi:hypothetical protein